MFENLSKTRLFHLCHSIFRYITIPLLITNSTAERGGVFRPPDSCVVGGADELRHCRGCSSPLLSHGDDLRTLCGIERFFQIRALPIPYCLKSPHFLPNKRWIMTHNEAKLTCWLNLLNELCLSKLNATKYRIYICLITARSTPL